MPEKRCDRALADGFRDATDHARWSDRWRGCYDVQSRLYREGGIVRTFRTRAQKGYEERHDVTLKAIDILAEIEAGNEPDMTIAELAKEYGTTRQAVYQKVHVALDDPVARLEQAEAEVEFRRKVLELVRGRANMSRAADKSILPAVATSGMADESPHHDDHVGEGDPEIFDPIHPLGKLH
jgi:hypothetical protein